MSRLRGAERRLLQSIGYAYNTLPGWLRLLLSTWVVYIMRYFVDGFFSWLQWAYFFNSPHAYAQDQAPIAEGVQAVDWLWYGPQRCQLVHRLTPTAECAKRHHGPTRALLYCHGGGFVFASSTVLIHSVTAFVRQGFMVYSIDYPLAPESRFPGPLVSVLQAFNWLRVTEGVDKVVVLGDSAGASLVGMAVAMIQNPDLLRNFAKEIDQPQLMDWHYPRIESLALLYGLLDQKSWRGRHLKQIAEVENFLAEGGISTALDLYRSNVFGGRLTLMDVLDDVHNFPRTLFVGGSQDPLIYSTIAVHEHMLKRGFDVHCKIYPARHGFFGVPPQWTRGLWRASAAPAMELLVHFFQQSTRGHRRQCSLTKTGVTCCVKEVGDYGHHALLLVDRDYEHQHRSKLADDEDESVRPAV